MSNPPAPRTDPVPKPGLIQLVGGWAIHALTASGAVFGLLAILAIMRGDARTSLLWLALALAIDALDGPLARKLKVRHVIPHVDGAVLDLVVDYLNYVLVPAVFLYSFDLLPDGWGLAGAGFVLLTSLYCFANINMKTADNYFDGFPAIWNVVILYLWILDSPALVNAVIVAALGILTFVPIKFVHPIRVREGRNITYVSTFVWSVCALALLAMSPRSPWWLLAPWLGASGWLACVSLRRTWRGSATSAQ